MNKHFDLNTGKLFHCFTGLFIIYSINYPIKNNTFYFPNLTNQFFFFLDISIKINY